ICWRRNDAVGFSELECGPRRFCNLTGFIANLSKEHLDLGRIQVTQLETKHYLAWYHIVRTGPRLKLADCSDLPAWRTGHNSIDCFDKLCRRQHHVAPLVHWRRTRVICKALDLHLPLRNTHNTLDHTDI